MNNGEILSKFVDEDFGVHGRDGSRWFKGVDHDSIVIDMQKGIFFFNSKGIVGDPLVYLTRIRKMSFNDAKEYLKTLNYSGTHVYSITKKNEDVVVYPALVDVFFDLGRESDKREYLYNRGINNDIIDRFRIGWYNNWTMIPFFMDGTFRNFQMRRDKPSRSFRGYYDGVGPLLFNSDILKLTDEVFITEGPLDALALIQNGIPAVSTNMSGRILEDWYMYFINQKRIYLVFDNDSAGVNEAKETAQVLGVERCKIYNFQNFTEQKGYDPVDYFIDGRTGDEFLELVYGSAKHLYELEDTGFKYEGSKTRRKGNYPYKKK